MKRVFVTGGAHGIGRAIVEAFCQTSDRVAFCDIDKLKGEELAHTTGAKFFHFDVCDKRALESCMQMLFKDWGDLDVELLIMWVLGASNPLQKPLLSILKRF